MPTNESISVSPYLLRPLRSYEQALRDRAELRSLRERAIESVRGRHAILQPLSAAPQGSGD